MGFRWQWIKVRRPTPCFSSFDIKVAGSLRVEIPPAYGKQRVPKYPLGGIRGNPEISKWMLAERVSGLLLDRVGSCWIKP